MFEDVRHFVALLDLQPRDHARGKSKDRTRRDWSALEDVDPRRDATTDEGPATGFRDAVTDGASVWGPILGGVVAVGGGIALVGTLLKNDEHFDPNLACPSTVEHDSCAPSSALHWGHA